MCMKNCPTCLCVRAKSKVTDTVLIKDMLFIDDAALTMHTEQDRQQLTCQLIHTGKNFELTISIKKINAMGQDITASPSISINNTVLGTTDHFTYLGSSITNNLFLDLEIGKDITKPVLMTA